MSHEILIQDLRRQEEEKIKALWLAAEAEVRKLKKEAADRIKEEEALFFREQSRLSADSSQKAVMEAEHRAGTIRAQAERALADRLYAVAQDALQRFRKQAYEDLFIALVRELPSCEWQTVRVNPADRALARKYFPGARLETDMTIAGGMEVVGEAGGIKVTNTLEKRLERAWPHILPDLLNQISREPCCHAPSP